MFVFVEWAKFRNIYARCYNSSAFVVSVIHFSTCACMHVALVLRANNINTRSDCTSISLEMVFLYRPIFSFCAWAYRSCVPKHTALLFISKTYPFLSERDSACTIVLLFFFPLLAWNVKYAPSERIQNIDSCTPITEHSIAKCTATV